MERRRFMALTSMGALTGTNCRRSPESPGSNRTALVLPSDGEVRAGGSRLIDIGGGYRVWTKKVGNAPLKILLMHGGPGADHTYFECF
jgi:proline iminopeptidase